MKKCLGCGITLQNQDSNLVGYTPDIEKDLCERCFKLKNYNVLTNRGVVINNDDVLYKINSINAFVFYLVDFINIDNEVIENYKKINNDKMLVLTKSDLIPKNIKLDDLVLNIKKVYNIKEDILTVSSNDKYNINILTNICMKKKDCLFVGFTNAGKSSLINALIGSNLTISKHLNTTQDFIKLSFDGINIYDAPGFMSSINREYIPKRIIRPLTYQLINKYYLIIGNIELNIKDDTNLTIYLSNDVLVDRRKKLEEVSCDIIVPSDSDLVIKGFCFIKFKESAFIKLNTTDYEIRPSIVGGYHE